jgi:hypothetical protein
MYVCTYLRMYEYMYVHKYVCMYVCMYVSNNTCLMTPSTWSFLEFMKNLWIYGPTFAATCIVTVLSSTVQLLAFVRRSAVSIGRYKMHVMDRGYTQITLVHLQCCLARQACAKLNGERSAEGCGLL